MIAIPAEAINYLNRDDGIEIPQAIGSTGGELAGVCMASESVEPAQLAMIDSWLDLDRTGFGSLDIV